MKQELMKFLKYVDEVHCDKYGHRMSTSEEIVDQYLKTPSTLSQFVIPEITQLIIQKWYRDVHKVYVEVTHFTNQPMDDEVWEDCYQVFVDGEGLHPYYKTYEGALGAGLLEASNLI